VGARREVAVTLCTQAFIDSRLVAELSTAQIVSWRGPRREPPPVTFQCTIHPRVDLGAVFSYAMSAGLPRTEARWLQVFADDAPIREMGLRCYEPGCSAAAEVAAFLGEVEYFDYTATKGRVALNDLACGLRCAAHRAVPA
jgi:hypothetical protein